MKILLLSPNQISRYNWGHQLFRNEISKHHEVVYWGEGYPDFDESFTTKEVIDRYCNSKPDLIMTYGLKYSLKFKDISKVSDIKRIHVAVDYIRISDISKRRIRIRADVQRAFFEENNYDLIFGITTPAVNLLKEHKACKKIRFLPFSVDTNVFRKLDISKDSDVLVAYTVRPEVYPYRHIIRDILINMDLNSIVKRVIHKRLVKAINRSKIVVTSNNIFESFSMRYTETLACGGFLLADRPKDLNRLGYEDGKHFVVYDGFDDFKEKILYYIKPENDNEREKIANNGMKFVRKNHSCEVRVKQMTDIITEELYGN